MSRADTMLKLTVATLLVCAVVALLHGDYDVATAAFMAAAYVALVRAYGVLGRKAQPGGFIHFIDEYEMRWPRRGIFIVRDAGGRVFEVSLHLHWLVPFSKPRWMWVDFDRLRAWSRPRKWISISWILPHVYRAEHGMCFRYYSLWSRMVGSISVARGESPCDDAPTEEVDWRWRIK